MSKMAELSMQIDELVEQGMSAKFIAVTLNVPLDWAQQAIEDRMDLEMLKQYDMQQDSASYEDFSPFDTYNS